MLERAWKLGKCVTERGIGPYPFRHLRYHRIAIGNCAGENTFVEYRQSGETDISAQSIGAFNALYRAVRIQLTSLLNHEF